MAITPGKTSPIGASLPRPKARQLAAGRGRFLDDLRIPGVLHAAFFRSPYPHARLLRLDLEAARASPGVTAVYCAGDIAKVMSGWTARMPSLASHRSVTQGPLVAERALWQGQPVAIVIAEDVALAEDAAASIAADWEPLPALSGAERALGAESPLLHPELDSNVLFEHRLHRPLEHRTAGRVIRRRIRFGRHTGVSLETRGLIAEFDTASGQLTVHASTQVPHQMRAVLAHHLAIAEHQVRVIVPDVGGGFGVKLHCYDDEMAAVAAARLLGRPVKFVCDRLDAFASDIHARAHTVDAAVTVADDGTLLAFSVDDQVEGGGVSVYPRTSALEAVHAVTGVAAPYRMLDYEARARIAFQNKPPVGSYRGVGQPIACAVTELMVDAAARACGLDPIAIRRHNFRSQTRDGPRTPGGLEPRAELSFDACLDQLLQMMDYDGLRQRQRAMRESGRWLGIGLAAFIEQSAPNSMAYGANAIPISAGDGCSLRLEPGGTITCITSAQFQGQGLEMGISQLVAHGVGLDVEAVRIVHGDTAITPVGGGTWASRGITIAGEAALKAVVLLRTQILRAASALLEAAESDLELTEGSVRIIGTDRSIGLDAIGFALHHQAHRFSGRVPEPMVTAHFQPTEAYQIANGVQASLVEVDRDTGLVRLLGHWVVDDCGRLINPLLVDEQLRGGVVQGIGAALFEECRYDDEAQLLSATLADYLVPMAAEMPDIAIGHIESEVTGSLLGGKGVGEASIVGAAAAVVNAINDALAPAGVEIFELPVTPQRLLRAMGSVPADVSR